MIISHKHKFIFFAVPKTATHTIRQALRSHLGENDWEQQVLFGKQSIPIPEIAAIVHGHISCRQLQPALDQSSWNEYLKFALVRNPYDRFVSTCAFLNRENGNYAGNEMQFMKQALRRERFRQRILAIPQSELLIGESGELAVDYVGRFEALQSCYDEVCSRISIPTEKLESKNRSEHKTYTSYYDVELQQAVAEFYQSDFKLFGYNPDMNTHID